MKRVTLYHSVVCPRCHFATATLNRLLTEFPDIAIDKVEYLTNRSSSKRAGVTSIPSLVSGNKKLSGFLLTRSRIRQFLELL